MDAKLASGEYVPRIPPLGGQVKLDVPVGKLRLAPRLRWASRMDRLYRDETPTDGYAVFDFTASYVFVGGHTTHNISLGAYNITDAEYSHHNSLIKDMAPRWAAASGSATRCGSSSTGNGRHEHDHGEEELLVDVAMNPAPVTH